MTDLPHPDQSPGVRTNLATAVPPKPAFRDLYEANFGYAWQILRRLGVWERELEDAVHDVFVVVHRRWDHYDPQRPFKPWLAGIATRVASDFRRRSQNRHEVVAEVFEGDVVDGRLSADQVVSQKEDRNLVMQALATLQAEQRTVFVLHELQGLSMPEIHEAVDAPLNTLYSRLRLARNSFTAAVKRLRRGQVQP